jgi:hypothetical protein
MHADLQRLFEQIENQRNQVLSQVMKLTPAQYTLSKNGKWSLAQILTHLITSEKLSLGYMKKKSLGIDSLENSGLLEELRYSILKASQYISFLKYKAPKLVVERTPPALSITDVKKEWDALRAEMKKFLDELGEKNVRKKIYKHPVAGRLNAIQAIGFFGDHFNHHLPQIKRLL